MGRARTGIAGAAIALLGLAGCGSPEGQPAATVTATSQTCDAGAPCTTSGHLRWTYALPGPYRLDNDLGPWLEPVSLGTGGDGFAVTRDGNHVLLLASDTITALDASTGQRLWQRTLHGDLRSPAWYGDRLVVESIAPGGKRTWLSVDPSRPDTPLVTFHVEGRPLAVDYGSDAPRYAADKPLVYLTPAYGEEAPDVVTRIDPVTGKPLWRHEIKPYRGHALTDGILYLDDTTWRTDPAAKAAGRRLRAQAKQAGDTSPPPAGGARQARAVQRIDLRSGKLLDDRALPRPLWRNLGLDRVTDGGVAVFSDYSTDDNDDTIAVDLRRGTQVATPPEKNAESGRRAQVTTVRVGQSHGERIVAKDAQGHTRWRGPTRLGFRLPTLLPTDPRIVVAASCLPDGLRRTTLTERFDGVICTAPVLEAYTW